MIHDRRAYQLRFEWGPHGVEALSPVSDSVVIVDVLTFSTAIAVFESARSHLLGTLRDCASGRELAAWGFEDDVALPARLNSDDVAPRLRDGAFSACPFPG